jgi:hypothetical protein
LGPPETHRLEPDEVRRYFTDPMFTLVDEFPAGDYHYALVFRKGAEPPEPETTDNLEIHVPIV